jgi:hypothetical protein
LDCNTRRCWEHTRRCSFADKTAEQELRQAPASTEEKAICDESEDSFSLFFFFFFFFFEKKVSSTQGACCLNTPKMCLRTSERPTSSKIRIAKQMNSGEKKEKKKKNEKTQKTWK